MSRAPARSYRATTAMRIVVDNSAGGDSAFAAEVARLLRARGFEVEVRPPDPRRKFDTSVNLLTAGIAVRVDEAPDRALLAAIEADVRAALIRHPSLRRRTRSVPVHLGDGPRVLEWIDVFG
jgi:hypothetical protein